MTSEKIYAMKIVDLVKAAIAREREACAQIANKQAGGKRIAQAIRARSK
jgi:hypothetical protein